MKKILLILFVALAAPVLFSSCEREVDFNDAAADTAALKQKAMEQMAANQPAMLENARCAPAYFSVSPCDDRFRVQVTTSGGSPLPYTCQYYIYTQSWGLADSGFVSHNQSTNSVLNYCTNYWVYIYDPCTGNWHLINALSDGCNNTFLC